MKHLNIKILVCIILVLAAGMLVFPSGVFAKERLAVKVSIANMRSGPGKQFKELWQVEKYHPVIVIEKKGKWYKIRDFENDKAWIHNSLLADIQSVITIKEKCNVRSKASKNGRILFTVEKGVPFKVLEKKGNWIKIKHADNDVGWIYKTLVW